MSASLTLDLATVSAAPTAGDHEEELESLGAVLDTAIDPHREINAVGAAALILKEVEQRPLCETLDAAVRRGVRRALDPSAHSNALGVALLVRAEVAAALDAESHARLSA